LIRYAVLAPSSHNTQPWLFRTGEGWIDLLADPRRWLRIADAGRRELHLSLGAALENLLIAAEHFGYGHDVAYFPDLTNADWIARVSLTRDARSRPPSLFDAIPRRQTDRRPYSGQAVDAGLLADLSAASADLGVWAWTSTDEESRSRVAGLVARGDRVEHANPAFRRELGDCIGQGLLGVRGPLATVARFAVTRLNFGERIARSDAKLVFRAGALLAVVSKEDDPAAQLRAGRAVERVWLLGTLFGLALQPMSQPLQVPDLRRELAEVIGAGGSHPQHLFRLGHAAKRKHRARRRPLAEVLLP
jgi:hypothetical protein